MQVIEIKILCKWSGNFCSNRLERKKWGTSEGLPFVPENFHLKRAFHLHFNWLDWRFWLNGKYPRTL